MRRIEAQCDPVRVAQIMRILIDNALTHNPPGTHDGGHRRPRQRRPRPAGRPRRRRRASTRQAAQRIFEPFYTADAARGSGLGLAIASELAERMAGALSVDSGDGRTEFTLEHPGLSCGRL